MTEYNSKIGPIDPSAFDGETDEKINARYDADVLGDIAEYEEELKEVQKTRDNQSDDNTLNAGAGDDLLRHDAEAGPCACEFCTAARAADRMPRPARRPVRVIVHRD